VVLGVTLTKIAQFPIPSRVEVKLPLPRLAGIHFLLKRYDTYGLRK